MSLIPKAAIARRTPKAGRMPTLPSSMTVPVMIYPPCARPDIVGGNCHEVASPLELKTRTATKWPNCRHRRLNCHAVASHFNFNCPLQLPRSGPHHPTMRRVEANAPYHASFSPRRRRTPHSNSNSKLELPRSGNFIAALRLSHHSSFTRIILRADSPAARAIPAARPCFWSSTPSTS